MNATFLKASQKIKDTTPLTGDAGNRSYARVQFEGSDKKFILCNYPHNESEQLKNFIDVYTLLDQNGVLTPKVIEASQKQMLLEDLGDQSLEDFYKSGGTPYSAALDQLIQIQKISLTGSSNAQSFSFTVEKFAWEMNFTLEHFSKFLKIQLTPQETVLLKKDFDDLCTHLCTLEQVITHRDFHSRNLMVKDNMVYVIDFQDARIGPKFYDLVSLIEDSYTNLSTAQKEILINDYCKRTQVIYDKNFMSNYHMQNLQRSFKAAGSFASFKNRTNNERYLQYLSPVFESLSVSCDFVDGLNSLKSFIELSSQKWNEYNG